MPDFHLPVVDPSNCAIGGCAARNIHKTCPSCVHWEPSQGSKYYHCNQWQSSRALCNLPRSACATCEHHISKGLIGRGRPATSGIDWTDPEQVRAYNREAKRRSRYLRAVKDLG